MANECSNEIIAYATASEWREIKFALENKIIDWPVCLDGPSCGSNLIYCTTKWSPTPWDDGYMSKMSELYPSVLFHYVTQIEDQHFSPYAWFYNQRQSRNHEALSDFNNPYEVTMKLLEQNTSTVANGFHHRVEIMPDGRAAADGENRFGECNIFNWENISQVSCGNWHTVAITKNGALEACGSNANGQCDVYDIKGIAVSVSCGRYHTAILLDNGKVIIRGNIEQRVEFSETVKEPDITSKDFPIIEKLRLDGRCADWDKMNKRIENISDGDELFLRNTNLFGTACFEVLDKDSRQLGFLQSSLHRRLSKIMQNIRITALDVLPLSSRKKGVKFATMSLMLNYSETPIKNLNIIGNYSQTKIASWPAVKTIKSIYDATIGITEDGTILIDGYCPCSVNDLKQILPNFNTTSCFREVECLQGPSESLSGVLENGKYERNKSKTNDSQPTLIWGRSDSSPVLFATENCKSIARKISHSVSSIVFQGRTFVHTACESELKIDEYVTARGGFIRPSTVLDTDYIIIGNDIQLVSTKARRALELNNDRGKNIKALTEEEFWDLCKS